MNKASLHNLKDVTVYIYLYPILGADSQTKSRDIWCAKDPALAWRDWMATLFSPDRPDTADMADVMAWYVPSTLRCLAQIWKTAEAVLDAGHDVVLEVGLIQQHQRDAFYARMGPWADAMVVYVLDAQREVRRERVLRRNAEQGETFSMVVPPHIFELASDLWQPPGDVECAERTVVFVPMAER